MVHILYEIYFCRYSVSIEQMNEKQKAHDSYEIRMFYY